MIDKEFQGILTNAINVLDEELVGIINKVFLARDDVNMEELCSFVLLTLTNLTGKHIKTISELINIPTSVIVSAFKEALDEAIKLNPYRFN